MTRTRIIYSTYLRMQQIASSFLPQTHPSKRLKQLCEGREASQIKPVSFRERERVRERERERERESKQNNYPALGGHNAIQG
jgi:hypothetical protein